MPNPNLTKALLGAAAVLTAVSGCAKYEQQDQGAKVDVAAVKAAITADEKKWNDDFKAKNLDALLGHYASDAYFVAPGVAPANGAGEIRKAYEEALKDPAFEISFASDKIDIASSGDLAYSRGHFTEKFTHPDTNQVTSDSGAYVTVYKKQADGSWKVVEDFTAPTPSGG
jgi:uncharacterized protein (TIGR02246 family)